jgi:hypothetical protein
VLVGLGVVLRLWRVDDSVFTPDESYTAVAVDRPWFDVPSFIADTDPHPPLYYLVAQPFTHLTDSEWALRLPSALLAIAALALFAWWQRDRGLEGVVAVGLFALSPFQLIFVPQARMYGLMVLAGVAAAFASDRWLRDGGRRWAVVAALSGLLGSLGQASGVLLAGALVLVPGLRRDREAWEFRLAALAAVALFGILWGATALDASGESLYASPDLEQVTVTVNELHAAVPDNRVIVLPLLLVGAVLLVRNSPRMGRVWLALAAAPALAALVVSFRSAIFIPKTLAIAAWALPVAFAALVGAAARVRPLFGALVAAVLLIVTLPYVQPALERTENSEGIVRATQAALEPGDAVAAHPPRTLIPWYLGARGDAARPIDTGWDGLDDTDTEVWVPGRARPRSRRARVRRSAGHRRRLPASVSRSLRTQTVESSDVSTNVSASSRPAGPPSTTSPAVDDNGWTSVRSLLRRPFVAGLVLLLVYLALSFVTDSAGFLGTDTGGKVATVKVMSERGDFDPDVGYWAEQWDPDGRVHGLYYTNKVGDRFVNVTSLPMVLAARPLWDLGGYRATLLLPMAGAVAAAFAARELSRRMRAPDDGWGAFWVIGLASPLLIYALDLWEHSLGVAFMAWGTVALVDAVRRHPTWWRGALAGLAFGVAASMRTEAFVYVLTTTAVACVALVASERRQIAGALVVGATAVAGFALAFGGNLALEAAVMGDEVRGGRASGRATSAISDLGVRAEEGLVTLFSPFPTLDTQGWLTGICLFVALAYCAWASTRKASTGPAVIAATAAALVLAWRFSDGLGFVPGLVAATPFAAAGIALGGKKAVGRLLIAMALVPVPLVILYQFVGGAAPQWAGRYLLASGFLLAVVGISSRDRMARWARVGFVVASAAVTLFGSAWLVQRSHQIADAADRLQARPESVLISPNGFIPREFGATYGDKDWLSTGNAEDLDFAVEVVRESGRPDFALVDLDTTSEPPTFPGWFVVDSEVVPFISGVEFRVTTYERVRPPDG